MSKSLIIKNTGIYTIGLILPNITSFFLLPLYTRYLMPSEYGILALVTSFSLIAGIFISLQLSSGIGRYVLKFIAADNKEEARKLFSTNIIFMMLAMIISFFILEYYGQNLVNMIFPKSRLSFFPYFQISIITLIFSTFYQTVQGLFRVLQEAKKYFLISVIVLVITIAFNLYFIVVLRMGLIGLFYGILSGAIAGFITSFILARNWFTLKFVPKYFNTVLKYSLPIIPHTLGVYLFTMSNRIILEKFVSLHDIGIFSVADRIALVPMIAVDAFNRAYSPDFIKNAEKDINYAVEYNLRVLQYWVIGVGFLVLGYVLFTDFIIKFMATEKYYQAIGVAIILGISSVFRGFYCFAVNTTFFSGKTIYLPLITLVTGIISIFLNMLIIPKNGIIGAAWVTVFSYAVTFVIAEWVSKKSFRIKYPVTIIGFVTLSATILFVIREITARLLNMSGIYSFALSSAAIFIFGVLIYFFIRKKQEFAFLFQYLKKLGISI